jgi:hypothetical protein
LAFYFGIGTSEPKIREFFENVGIQISAGEISNLLIKKHEDFHAEKDAVFEAGLQGSPLCNKRMINQRYIRIKPA